MTKQDDENGELAFFVGEQAQTLKKICDLKSLQSLSEALALVIAEARRLASGQQDKEPAKH